jgi:preprotein translocase subunit SecF
MQISAGLIAVSLIALVVRDLNLGIEFEGGLAVTGPNPAGASVEDLRSAAEAAGAGEVVVQMIDDGNSFRVQTPALDEEPEDAFLDGVAAVTGTPRVELSVDAVGPSFGALILRRSLLALAVFLAAVTLFMTWRMEWKMAVAGLAALFHDLIITTGVYAVTGFEVTPATIVAILTILGYSLYDTVVVFDKVGEMVSDYGDRMTYSDLVNRSMNIVLARSLNTSLTSLIPVGSILFVGALILGASTLKDFALALFVGIAVSTYSSIFVAAPLLAAWKEWSGRRRKLSSRGVSTVADVAPEKASAATASKPPRRPPVDSTDRPPRRPGAGATPRPPKKRKR